MKSSLLSIGTAATVLLIAATLSVRADTSLPTQPAFPESTWKNIAPFFHPPEQYAGVLSPHRSPLKFDDGTEVKTPEDWPRRRKEILDDWHRIMGPWPKLLEKPKIEITKTERRENFTQNSVTVEVDAKRTQPGYLLVPDGPGPFPAILVVYYEPETSIGLGKAPLRDFGLQLTRRGFVTLSIGEVPNSARDPKVPDPTLQPLSYLAYVGANCHSALAALPNVDAKRIGIVGHSFGGKWAMMASCLYDKFAAAVWCDPDLVFDESKANANYWEPWYLGAHDGKKRTPGIPNDQNPRTGAYKTLLDSHHDLTELHALMAPRPFLVSGGAEDPPDRWPVLNHAIAVNKLLGYTDRVAFTARPDHTPTPESNQQLCDFFVHFLKPPAPTTPPPSPR